MSALWSVSDIVFWGPIVQMNRRGLSLRESVQTPKTQAANITCGGGSDPVWFLTIAYMLSNPKRGTVIGRF